MINMLLHCRFRDENLVHKITTHSLNKQTWQLWELLDHGERMFVWVFYTALLLWLMKTKMIHLSYLSCKWPPNAHTKANAKELVTFPVSLARIPELCLLLVELTDCRCLCIMWIVLSSSCRRICLSKMADRYRSSVWTSYIPAAVLDGFLTAPYPSIRTDWQLLLRNFKVESTVWSIKQEMIPNLKIHKD